MLVTLKHPNTTPLPPVVKYSSLRSKPYCRSHCGYCYSVNSMPSWWEISVWEVLHGLKVDCFKKVWPLPDPQVDLSAPKHAADPIGQRQTEMVGEPWCYFLQHLLMRFAWCSPIKTFPAGKMYRSLLISVMSFANSVISLTILRRPLQWKNATSLSMCVNGRYYSCLFNLTFACPNTCLT